jgi:hypothetical protein
MPPRYAYWTILIDNMPTAFRAREKEELLPTLQQLKRTAKDVVMKWFAQGRLWESPEQARATVRAPNVAGERRSSAWRPGGQHKDPRDRFKKPGSSRGEGPSTPPPWRDKPPGGSTDRRPWSGKPQGPTSAGPRPWRDAPRRGPLRDRTAEPQRDKSTSGAAPVSRRAHGDSLQRGQNKPSGGSPRGDRPWRDNPTGGSPGGQKPWRGQPRDHNRRDQPPARREALPTPTPHTESPTKPPPPEQAAIKPKPPERE